MHEAMNLAGVRRLPIVYIIDNNLYAYSTPNSLSFGSAHLADRGPAYGFEGIVIDGTDVLTVHREVHRAVEKRARRAAARTLLEVVTLRMEGHAVHDDASYVPRELVDEYLAKDPVDRFRAWLQVNHEPRRGDEKGDPGRGARTTIEQGVAEAEACPAPDPSTLLDGVYAE